MKKILIISILLTCSVFLHCKKLTLSESLKLAQRFNPIIKARKAEYRKSVYDYKKSTRLLLPDFNYSLSSQRSRTKYRDLSSTQFANFGSGTGTLQSYQTLNSSSYTMNTPVFNRKFSLMVRQSLVQQKITLYRYKMQMKEIEFQIILAYLKILKAKALYDLEKENLKLSELQFEMIQNRFNSGLTIRTDVLKGELAISEEKEKVIIANNNYTIACLELNKLIGWGIFHKFDPADIKLELKLSDIPGKMDYNRRYEYKILNEQKHLTEIQRKIVSSDNLPSINLSSTYTKSDSEFYPDTNSTWTASLQLAYKFFDFGETRYGIKGAAQGIVAIQKEKDNLRDQITHQVYFKHLKAKEANDRLKIIENAIKLSNENYEIMKDQYLNGMVTVLDLTEAETQKSDTRSKMINTRYDYYISCYEKWYAQGKELEI
ncbi:TolC family protein [bacterium]|nr:TolC family protein [bacterium]